MPRNVSLEVPTPENLELLRQRAEMERDMLDAAQNKSLTSRAYPFAEAALATLAPMITAPAAAIYGMGRTLASPMLGSVEREKVDGGYRYATPQDQAAADFMNFMTFMPRTQKGQEYTQDVASLFEASKLPHTWPVTGGGPKLGPGSMRYAGQSLELPGYAQTAPIGAVNLSKRRMFTLPKVEEKHASMPAVKEQLPAVASQPAEGALTVADPSRREFLKRSAANVATSAMLDATPVGILTKLATEPIAKVAIEAPVEQIVKAAEPITQIEKIVTPGYKDLGDLVADAIQMSVFENTDIVGPGNIGYFWLNIVDSLRRKGINNKELWRSKYAAQRLSAAELSEEGELSRQNYKDISHVGGLLEKYGDYIEPKDYLDAMPKGADVPFMFEELLTDDAALRKWLQKLPRQYDVQGVTKADIDNIMRDVFDVKPAKPIKKPRKK